MILNILIFLISCVFLILAGSWTVRSLTRLSVALRFSYFMAGFILMAFATTIPELLVGITSALERVPSLSLGNVIGSNMVNLGLVLALVAIFKGEIKIKSKIIKDDVLYLVPLVLLPLILLSDRSLSRLDGVVLLFAFLLYLIKLIKERREFKSLLEEGPLFAGCLLNFLVFGFSVFVLIFSAKYVVDYGILIARDLKFPLILIGLSAVAVGTSLPELVFALRAARLGREEMALGDLVGACAINASLVLGITALISPILEVDFSFLSKASIFLLLTLFLFVFDIRSKNGLSRLTGIFLLSLYLAFLILEFV